MEGKCRRGAANFVVGSGHPLDWFIEPLGRGLCGLNRRDEDRKVAHERFGIAGKMAGHPSTIKPWPALTKAGDDFH